MSMQCCMVSGEARCKECGEPEPGYSFYICPACVARLERLIEVEVLLDRRGVEQRKN